MVSPRLCTAAEITSPSLAMKPFAAAFLPVLDTDSSASLRSMFMSAVTSKWISQVLPSLTNQICP